MRKLSERQREVADMMNMSGVTNRMIANHLNISIARIHQIKREIRDRMESPLGEDMQDAIRRYIEWEKEQDVDTPATQGEDSTEMRKQKQRIREVLRKMV